MLIRSSAGYNLRLAAKDVDDYVAIRLKASKDKQTNLSELNYFEH